MIIYAKHMQYDIVKKQLIVNFTKLDAVAEFFITDNVDYIKKVKEYVSLVISASYNMKGYGVYNHFKIYEINEEIDSVLINSIVDHSLTYIHICDKPISFSSDASVIVDKLPWHNDPIKLNHIGSFCLNIHNVCHVNSICSKVLHIRNKLYCDKINCERIKGNFLIDVEEI